MSMRRYKRTCRPHPSLQASAWWTKRAINTGDVSLRSNDDTIVPNDLNRHDRKQLPRLSLRERLGNVVQLVYSLAAGQWRSSLRSNVYAVVLVSLIRYDREQFNKTEPLASLDSVAQLASAMATFSLRSNDTCSRSSRSVWLWPAQPALSARRYAPRDIECISMTKPCLLHTALSFRPVRCVMTQNDTFWKILYIYSNITKKNSYIMVGTCTM